MYVLVLGTDALCILEVDTKSKIKCLPTTSSAVYISHTICMPPSPAITPETNTSGTELQSSYDHFVLILNYWVMSRSDFE